MARGLGHYFPVSHTGRMKKSRRSIFSCSVELFRQTTVLYVWRWNLEVKERELSCHGWFLSSHKQVSLVNFSFMKFNGSHSNDCHWNGDIKWHKRLEGLEKERNLVTNPLVFSTFWFCFVFFLLVSNTTNINTSDISNLFLKILSSLQYSRAQHLWQMEAVVQEKKHER